MEDSSDYSFLSSAYGKNHFLIDWTLRSLLKFYRIEQNFEELGSYAGGELYELGDYIDKVAHPKHIMWSVDGRRVDRVWLHPKEADSLAKLIRTFHINILPYEEDGWFKHFASIYLIADPGIACIITVTNQTAFTLYKYGDKEQRKIAENLMGKKEPLMFGATWFTEVHGGSDLGSNKTEATRYGKLWKLNGEKYFASNAGLADYALVTARPKEAPRGAKGLGLFLLPRYNSNGELNFSVLRLKEKSATVAVPTGEIELNDSEASAIGDIGKGIYYTMESLMVSRLANSFGAVGIAKKAFFESMFYASKREAFGRKIVEHPLVRRDLLDMDVSIAGSLALSFKAVEHFQTCWRESFPYTEKYNYSRLLTHVAKNITAETAFNVTRTAMELHGGVGFLREYPVERLHREALITPIWEGTSNIQALDMLEVILKKGAHFLLIEELESMTKLAGNKAKEAVSSVEEEILKLKKVNHEKAQFYSKELLNKLGHLLAALTLISIGAREGNKRLQRVGELYFVRFVELKSYPEDVIEELEELLYAG